MQIGTGLTYVVQTAPAAIQRCVLMTTDPGDLVMDPTCGSGTHCLRCGAVGADAGSPSTRHELPWLWLALASWGRAIPTTCLRTAWRGGRRKQSLPRPVPSEGPTGGDIRQGFVYERVPHITLKSIANNAEIDVIWERWQGTLEPLRAELNGALGRTWEEWEIPRAAGTPWPETAAAAWKRLQSAQSDAQKGDALLVLNSALRRNYTVDEVPDQPHDPWDAGPTELHRRWWEVRIARQKEIDASIAAKGGLRVPVRQAIRGSRYRPRRRPVHGGEPGSAPHARCGRE